MDRLKRFKHWIVVAAWLAWFASALILTVNPSASPVTVLLLIGASVFGLGVPSVIVLALAYRRFLATWPGMFGLITGWALLSGGIGDDPRALAGLLLLAQLSLPVAYFVSVSAFLLRRDASVAILAGLLLIGIWAAAMGVVRYEGPANFLIAYLRAVGNGTFWWWNAIAIAFWCALPPAVVAFCAHLLRLVHLEWKRR